MKAISEILHGDYTKSVKGKKGFQPVPVSKQKANTISTALTDAERETLQMLAAMEGVSMSKLVRAILKAYIDDSTTTSHK